MLVKTTERQTARALRKRGLSYSEIAGRVGVSQSSLSLWLRDLPLEGKQLECMRKRCLEKSWLAGSRANRERRIKSSIEIIEEAWKQVSTRTKDQFFVVGVMLYWAEGTKSLEMLIFSNSDPDMIRIMMQWFRKYGEIPEKKFRIQVHIHSLHSRPQVEKYWSQITGVPLRQFIKTQIKETSLGHRKNILYNGTCCIRVSDRALFRRIVGWRLGFLEQFGVLRADDGAERREYVERFVYRTVQHAPVAQPDRAAPF